MSQELRFRKNSMNIHELKARSKNGFGGRAGKMPLLDIARSSSNAPLLGTTHVGTE